MFIVLRSYNTTNVDIEKTTRIYQLIPHYRNLLYNASSQHTIYVSWQEIQKQKKRQMRKKPTKSRQNGIRDDFIISTSFDMLDIFFTTFLNGSYISPFLKSSSIFQNIEFKEYQKQDQTKSFLKYNNISINGVNITKDPTTKEERLEFDYLKQRQIEEAGHYWLGEHLIDLGENIETNILFQWNI